MDLLGENPNLCLNDEEWRIYSRHDAHSPQFVGPAATIENSSITEGCEIYGTVINSVLGAGVCVMEGATVSNSVIMDDVLIGTGSTVNYTIVDTGCRVGSNCKIGKDEKKSKGITVIGAGVHIPDGTEIGDSQMISDLADIKEKEQV
jgi:glucose-1-phosphate adenylyltransferase